MPTKMRVRSGNFKRTRTMTESFRKFADAAYRAPGVAQACIDWQDRLGADVLVILWCHWTCARGMAMNAALLQRAMLSVGPIELHLLRPLRAARRALSAAASHIESLQRCKVRVSAREVECEWLKARVLVQMREPLHTSGEMRRTANAEAALGLYLRLLGIEDEQAQGEAAALSRLIGRAIGE
jgi:uncharacterized protein (TIGR02444 family)